MTGKLITISLVTALGLALPAVAGPGQNAVLNEYRALARKADPAFQGFSASRGQAFFSTNHSGGNPDFGLAWLSAEEARAIHVWTGYAVGLLIVARLVWGFVGPKHARFSDFLRGPVTSIRYLFDLISFRAKRYLGHSPAGAAMVFALLLSLSGTVLTGIALYGAKERAGPLAGLYASVALISSKALAEETEGASENDASEGHGRSGTLKEAHEFFANLTLGLVILHVAGVLWASWVHRENLAKAMITGNKRP